MGIPMAVQSPSARDPWGFEITECKRTHQKLGVRMERLFENLGG